MRATLPMLVGLWLGVLGCGLGALRLAVGGGGSNAERAVGAGTLAVAALLLLAVAVWFGALRITVRQGEVRFGFGPFRVQLDGSQLLGAEPERYRWWQYGGWGLRWRLLAGGKERAYTVPFMRQGVAVIATDGRRYHVSSRRPARLAETVNALASASGVPRGSGGRD